MRARRPNHRPSDPDSYINPKVRLMADFILAHGDILNLSSALVCRDVMTACDCCERTAYAAIGLARRQLADREAGRILFYVDFSTIPRTLVRL